MQIELSSAKLGRYQQSTLQTRRIVSRGLIRDRPRHGFPFGKRVAKRRHQTSAIQVAVRCNYSSAHFAHSGHPRCMNFNHLANSGFGSTTCPHSECPHSLHRRWVPHGGDSRALSSRFDELRCAASFRSQCLFSKKPSDFSMFFSILRRRADECHRKPAIKGTTALLRQILSCVVFALVASVESGRTRFG